MKLKVKSEFSTRLTYRLYKDPDKTLSNILRCQINSDLISKIAYMSCYTYN